MVNTFKMFSLQLKLISLILKRKAKLMKFRLKSKMMLDEKNHRHAAHRFWLGLSRSLLSSSVLAGFELVVAQLIGSGWV